jgi:hypothetical protein
VRGEGDLRAGRSQALLRDVNDGIEQGRWPGEFDRPVRFRCECAQIDCNEAIELTVREYSSIREHPRRFALSSDHHRPGVESLVEVRPGYVVVEPLRLGEAPLDD